ncbi:MAG TPA: alpha/beta fold hydrolase [Candidatus Limnocylindria bacterium]|nr:alpha/beta fold hydrolase [Candidatus Limnocylindria bacterium]
MTEPAWKRRIRAASVQFPSWARDEADRLIYLTNVSGKFEVHEWDRRAGVHRQATDRPEGTGYRVPSRLDRAGRTLWWFDDQKGNELGRWMRQPFGGGPAATLAPDLAPAYNAGLSLGRDFVILGRSRADEGTTVELVTGKGTTRLYAHKEAASVGGLSEDERYFSIAHSERGDSRNRAIRVLDLEGRAIAELDAGPEKGYEAWSRWSPVRGDGRLLVHHDLTGTRRPAILDVTSGAPTEITLDLPGETTADWYPDAKALIVGHDHRGRTELYRYDFATRALTKLATEPGTIGRARVRPDGDVWYVLDQSAAPAQVRAVGTGVVLAPAGELAPRGVSYTDHDVSGVHCFVARPAGAGPHPTLFLIHGGPSSHDRDGFSPGVQAWVDHGIAVVLINYRGSSGYGKAWLDAIVGRPGLTELEDIAKVHDWAVGQRIADPERCGITGGSWGGYLTLLALGVQPERWAYGIGVVPIGDYVAAFEDEMEPLKRYDAALFGGTPAEVPESYRRSNPLTYADRVQVPLLMLVGMNDPRCPARSVDVYEARLHELGIPYEEYRYDAGHGSLVVNERIKQIELELDFANRALGMIAAAI